MAQTTPSESVRCRPWCFRLQMNPRATRNKSPCKEVVLILAPLVCSCGHPTECRSSIQEREVGLHPGIVLDCHLAVSRPFVRPCHPLPEPLSPPAASFLRLAPDKLLLTKPNISHKIENPGSLRRCSGSSRTPFGFPPD